MSQTRAQKQEQAEAIERLREWVKPGDTIYTVLRHVSSSGMSRVIDLKVIKGDDVFHIGYNAALAMGDKYDRQREGIKIGGCGMDMGFALVYNLASTLFRDTPEYESWKANRTDYQGNDAGYMLTQRWL